jgi:hypothetical protein
MHYFAKRINTMNNLTDKIKANSSKMRIFLIVIQALLIAATAASIAMLAFLLFRYQAQPLCENLMPSFSINGKSISNLEELISGLPSFIALFIRILLLQAVLMMLTRVFSAIIRQETPFSDSVLRCLKVIALILLISSVLPSFAELIIAFSLAIDSNIELISTPSLISALVAYSLSKIFEYGILLQRENDTTL